MLPGTHDIRSASVDIVENVVMLITRYFEQSTASGALFAFIHVGSDRIVNFNKSVCLAIDRDTSHRHSLPFDLHPGRYKVFAYDIETRQKAS